MKDFEIAIAVADAGATVLRRCFGTRLLPIEKGAGDFATNADLEAEQAMLAVLHRERPGDQWLEMKVVTPDPRGAVRKWLIDPLCGSRNYAENS